MIPKIKLIAALHDSSGYSEASRNYLAALDTLVKKGEIELCAVSPKFEMWNTDVGPYRALIDHYCAKSFEPDLQILHLTPDCYQKYISSKYLSIGYAAWETSKLPDKWVGQINALDEIWCPSAWNVDVFQSSGITIPTHRIPHAINVPDLLARADGEHLDFNIPAGKFAFYSIFQWTERKNPYGLLKTFFSEFTAKDDVVLVLKSYVKSHGAPERDFIRSEIQRVRQSMYLNDAAPVVFIGGDLSSRQIAQLHQQGDCLVLPTRSEGWSLTSFEAMAFGKPVITTDFSGHLEFCRKENSYLIPATMAPVNGMPWPLYTGRMMWAEPDLAELKRLMRWVYEHREEATAKGAIAAEDVKRFGWEDIGILMGERIKAVLGVRK